MACMPKKCATRRSPPSRAQPKIGRPPASDAAPPTQWPPLVAIAMPVANAEHEGHEQARDDGAPKRRERALPGPTWR